MGGRFKKNMRKDRFLSVKPQEVNHEYSDFNDKKKAAKIELIEL